MTISENQAPLSSKLAKTYPKSVALSTINSDTDLTLRKLKAVNVIGWATRNAFFTKNPHLSTMDPDDITLEIVKKSDTSVSIDQDFMMRALGFRKGEGYYSYTQVLALLDVISDQKIYFDSLGIATKHVPGEDWAGFSRLISSARRSDGHFYIDIPPDVLHRIVSPKASFEGLLDLSNINCKYSPPIMDTCSFYKQLGKSKTDWLEIELLRDMLKANAKTWEKFYKFNEKFLKPALADINAEKQLTYTVEFETKSEPKVQSKGRNPTTHIRFVMKDKNYDKEDLLKAQAENELTSHKTEIRCLGIAKNQIDLVIDECRDDNGEIMYEYLQWVNHRGFEFRSLISFQKIPINEFGGFFRKKIIRKYKDEWIQINEMLNDYLKSIHSIDKYSTNFRMQKLKLDEEVRKQIIKNHFISLSDHALTQTRDDFFEWLAKEIPSLESSVDSDSNLFEMLETLTHELSIFMRVEYELFTPFAYTHALSEVNY